MNCKNKNCKKLVETSVDNALYCKEHGCAVCFKHKGDVSVESGVKVCKKISKRNKFCDCQKRWEQLKDVNQKIRENLKNQQLEEDKNLKKEIKSVSEDFYSKIKETLKKIAEAKYQFIEKESENKKKQLKPANDFITSVQQLINNCSVLSNNERKELMKIYNETVSDYCLPKIFDKKKNFLVDLAKKYNDNIERERERERERANLLIQEIKAELASSPSVNITELPSTYHNYETWTVNDLVNGKDAIIKAIQTKRVQKQLQGLLNQANNCSDSDLWNFIQKLEKLLSNTASPTEQAFYSTHQNLVDATLSGLKQRWNNLSEAQKLVGYWNNAIQNFANWLKEAENLQLTSTDPFFNFKENIKECRTAGAVELQAQSAKKYILIKFQETVKQQLGTEQVPDEYQEIDKAKDFAEVKTARSNIKQRRIDYKSPSPSPNKNPEEKNIPPSGPREERKDNAPNNPSPEKEPDDNKDKGKNNDLSKLPVSAELAKLDLTEIKQIIQNRIESLLANLRTKLPSDSYKNLCAGKECWKKYLWENLTDKGKVIDFGQKMEKIVEGEVNRKNPNISNPSGKNFWITPIILISSFILLIFLVSVVSKKIRIKRKKNKEGLIR